MPIEHYFPHVINFKDSLTKLFEYLCRAQTDCRMLRLMLQPILQSSRTLEKLGRIVVIPILMVLSAFKFVAPTSEHQNVKKTLISNMGQ